MYEELVKRLRDISNRDSNIKSNYIGLTMIQAADAIDELSKYVNTIRRLKSEGWYLQQTKNHDGYVAVATMPLPEPPKK